jgi:MFS family permease
MVAFRVLATVFRNPELRRVELAFVAFNAAEFATWIAMLVFAYEQGEATTAGLVALAQLVPAGIFAPFAAALADRRGPAWMLPQSYRAQALTMGATALALFADAPPVLVYAFAATAATAVTFTRPAQSALLPGLARSPEELTSANVVSGWIESVSVFAAPAAAGVLLAISGPGTVWAVMAAVALAGGLLTIGLPGPAGSAERLTEASPLGETVAGFRLLARDRDARLLIGLLGAQFIGIGALDVLYVVLALGVLGIGESGAGYLNAAFGLGGVLGIAATAALVGRPHLARPLLAGVAVWAVALFALAGYATVIGAFVFLAAAGAGRSLLDVAGRTLLQRTAPTELLSRVFGVLEGLSMAALAIGSILTPALIALAGPKGALIGVGAILCLVALVARRRVLDIDRSATVPVTEIALLRSSPTFALLSPPQLERLARGLAPRGIPAGTTFLREGEDGEQAYVVADGELDVSVAERPVAVLRRGDLVGEIALLRSGKRTATVIARTETRLYELDSEAFFEIVGGNRAAAEALDELVDTRLGEIAEIGGRIPP